MKVFELLDELKEELEKRLPTLLECERGLMEGLDGEFRFHSGVPAAADC